MKFIREGVMRDVLLIGNWAIKFPKLNSWKYFCMGIIANYSEYEIWQWKDAEFFNNYKDILCPIIWSSWGKIILIMSRCRQPTVEEWNNWMIKDLNIFDFNLKYGRLLTDIKLDNCGILNNKLVVIDYGCSKYG